VGKIRVAIAGIGNCASSLFKEWIIIKDLVKVMRQALGLMHYDLGGYKPFDVEFVAAIDIDKRKVGRPLNKAVFAKPNCTKFFNPTSQIIL